MGFIIVISVIFNDGLINLRLYSTKWLMILSNELERMEKEVTIS
jgi:hypothetical protein